MLLVRKCSLVRSLENRLAFSLNTLLKTIRGGNLFLVFSNWIWIFNWCHVSLSVIIFNASFQVINIQFWVKIIVNEVHNLRREWRKRRVLTPFSWGLIHWRTEVALASVSCWWAQCCFTWLKWTLRCHDSKLLHWQKVICQLVCTKCEKIHGV